MEGRGIRDLTGRLSRASAAVLLIVTALAVVAVRLRLLDVPLERDEGEYAFVGWLLLQGVPPYAEAYSMKAPGIYGAYAAALAAFGSSPAGIRLGLLAANLAATAGIVLLGRRLGGRDAGAIAGAAFAVMSLSASVLGFAAHATQFVAPFAVFGLLALLRGLDGPRPAALALAGALLAVASTMKQHGLAFVAFAAAWIVFRASRRTVALSAFVAGACVPVAILWGLLAAGGVFPRYWFWNVVYAGRYVTNATLAQGVGSLGAHLAAMWPLCGFAALALPGLVPWRTRTFLGALLLASFLAIAPGFYFRSHYFVLLLPAVALAAGIGTEAIGRRVGPWAAAGGPLFAIALFLVAERAYLFRLSPVEISRAIYPGCPFAESAEIAERLAGQTRPGDRIAVLGSEPQIYFLAERRSASGYLYMYGLMEEQPYASVMQREMAAEVEAARPPFVVWCNVRTSWLQQRGSSTYVLGWARSFLDEHYERVGLVDMLAEGSRSVWGEGAAGRAPQGDDWVAIYRRK
jgi:hypothetical protein